MKGILENNKCYLLDCGAEVFVWVGRVTQVDDRKVASQVVEVEIEAWHLFLYVFQEYEFSFQPFISRTSLLVRIDQK